jgi:photosystem II stability/assembly factor-like uncharacterized protein
MSPKINRILIPFFIIILLSIGKQTNTSGQAQANREYFPLISYNPTGWIGPFGGTITTIVDDPSNPRVVFAGTFGSGVFKSENGGSYWQSVNQGLTNLFVYSLAIDPTQTNTLYVGTFHNQIYKSQDGGNSWTWSGSGIQDQAVVYSIAIDPSKPSTLYTSTRGVSNDGNPPWNGVIYKSVDAGQTWTPSLTYVGGIKVMDWAYSVIVNPNAPNQVFAAMHENGPYRSDNYGATWHAIHTGISDPSGRALVISPQPEYSSILYHGVWHYDSVYKSINNGDLWTQADNDIPNVMVSSMAIDPHSPDSVYMATFSNGLLKTLDGGRTWQYAGLQNDQIYAVSVNPGLTNNLFAGTSGDGLYSSMDYSKSWQHSDTGISNAIVTAVVHSPTDSNRIFASLYGAGVDQTINRGQSWDELNSGLGDKFVHDLVMDPAHPNLLYALTDTGGLYQNDLNTGTGWVGVAGGLPLTQTPMPAFPADHPFATLDMQEAFASPQVTLSANQATNVNLLKMVYAPSDPQIAYIATHGFGVYRSTNGGLSWLAAGLGEQTVLNLAVDVTDPNLVYAATDISGSLQISTDGGKSWHSSLLPVDFYSLAASPTESGVVYAGTSSGVYRFESGSWSALGLSDQSVTAIAIDALKSGVIIAGTTSGAYYTTDDGISWNYVNQQLSGLTIQSISFDPNLHNVMYFCTKINGIFLAFIKF